ncbi:glycosyltransferase family 4 protein [Stenotrophomonas sp. AR026]|uniref:glycosyltransferase family 4 protein n=1 Tax=Stenotrophomonas sp. AR026 TaxID=3398462 RepID=UPI003BB01CE4
MTHEKILFVCTQMEAGGVQRRSTAMSEALNAKGIPSRVVFLYRKRGAYDGLDFCHSLLMGKPKGLLDVLKVLWGLARDIRQFKPTAVVGMAHYSSPIAAIAAFALGVPNRIATQTNPPATVPLLGRILDYTCGVVGLYTSNICASHSIESDFSGHPKCYRRTLTTVVNGVGDLPPPSTELNRKSLRAKLGLDERSIVIVNCGRLSSQKNQALLVDCIKHIDAHLVIIGEGELRSDIEARIIRLGVRDKVTLVGEVAPSEINSYLSVGDIFAFPSNFEAFGLAAVEAMRSGLPIVSSNHPALAEVVGDSGVLIDPRDETRWISELNSLAVDNSRRSELADKSRSRAKHFSFERMLDGFVFESTKNSPATPTSNGQL